VELPALDTPARRAGAAAVCVIAIAAIVLGVVAITGGGGDGSDTPEAQVQATVDDFVNALGDQSFDTACGLLTADLRAQLGGVQCEQALVALAGQGATPPTVQITDVRIAGNKAAVDAQISSDSGSPVQHSLQLLEEDGQWRISSFGG
jgi:hypothetical protein